MSNASYVRSLSSSAAIRLSERWSILGGNLVRRPGYVLNGSYQRKAICAGGCIARVRNKGTFEVVLDTCLAWMLGGTLLWSVLTVVQEGPTRSTIPSASWFCSLYKLGRLCYAEQLGAALRASEQTSVWCHCAALNVEKRIFDSASTVGKVEME